MTDAATSQSGKNRPYWRQVVADRAAVCMPRRTSGECVTQPAALCGGNVGLSLLVLTAMATSHHTRVSARPSMAMYVVWRSASAFVSPRQECTQCMLCLHQVQVRTRQTCFQRTSFRRTERRRVAHMRFVAASTKRTRFDSIHTVLSVMSRQSGNYRILHPCASPSSGLSEREIDPTLERVVRC